MPAVENERRYVGSSIRRLEDPRFLTGHGRYVDDIHRPGALHVAFCRSPYAHALIRSIDTAQALQVPGVVGVFTAADLKDLCRPITGDSTHATYRHTERPVLVPDRVKMIGDPVAAVLAEDRHLAEDGVDEVLVDYEPLEPVMSVERALAEDSPRLHKESPDNVVVLMEKRTGDVDAAFRDADLTVGMEFSTQRYAAACMEPRAILAHYDTITGKLTAWMANQNPHIMRTGLSRLLDLPEHRIRVICPDVGGGFGQKAYIHAEDVVVTALARKLGCSVRWTSDRVEDLQASLQAREQRHQVQAAVSSDGRVLGIKADIVGDNGAYVAWPHTPALDVGQAADNMTGPYDIRNYERKAYAAYTNKGTMGGYRGIGRPHACLAIERIMDEVGRRLSIDPQEVRRRNLVREFPYVTASGFHLESGSYVEALDLALERLGYEELKDQHRALNDDGIFRGTGVACFVEQSAHGQKEWERKGAVIAPGYDTAEMSVGPDGTVRLAVGLHSHGQGQETTMAQIAADELATDIEDIDVVFGDTARVSYGFGSIASRATVFCGGATILAASEIREKAKRIAAHMLEADPADVKLDAKRFSIRGTPSSYVTWQDVARRANHEPGKLPEGIEPGLDATRKYAAAEWGSYSNAVHAVEVEVDTDTGQVEILRYVVVEDCGTIVNPRLVEGQVHGGVAQGLGGTFLEQIEYDEHGQLLSSTFMDYLIPGFCEVPEIEVHHLETPSPINVGGFKGMGEGGVIAPAPATANAIIDALKPFGDVQINGTPITPEVVLRALQEAMGKSTGSEPVATELSG